MTTAVADGGLAAHRPLSFGLSGLSAQTAGRARRDYHRELRRVIELSVLAEAEGLDVSWVCEHHFSDDGFLPAPFVALAAIGEHTERITIGTDILLAPMWDPARLAEEAAVVDQLSGGRVILGMGLGYREAEFTGLGFRKRERGRMFEERIRVLRAAWAAAPVGGLGLMEAGAVLPVTPPPLQDAGPQLWIGGFAEAAVRRVGRAGDGYIAPQIGPGGLRKRIGWLAEETPLDDFVVGLSVIAFVGARRAWPTVRPAMDRTEAQYRKWHQEAGDLEVLAAKPWDAGATEDQPPVSVVVGTPEECVRQLEPYLAALAAVPGTCRVHLATRLTYPGLSDHDNDESVRLFARDVVPALRARFDAARG